MVKRLIGACSVALALTAAALAQAPAKGEFRVNTYTTDRQYSARAAMEPDGDFVVVWTSGGQDGSNFGTFGQRFAASGVPRGSEFRINTYTTGFQHKPAVAVGSGGDFVVVWQSYQDGSITSIHGQRYDAAGSAIGSEFLVNTFTSDVQYGPHVGRASDGRFVVSWTSYTGDGNSYGIAARRFDASGNPIGSDFVVNTYTTNAQFSGALAVDANGDFVVVWVDFGNRDGSGQAVFGQRYDASGNRRGSEFMVNAYTTGNQRIPSVSVSPAGGFVVAWISQFGDGSSYAVFARRFDASGNAVGSDFVVNTYTTGAQFGNPGQVAHDASGNFVVTWRGPGDGSLEGSFAQRFSASGARLGAELQVNTYTTGAQTLPSVASAPAGRFVVVWSGERDQDGSWYGVFAQRYRGLDPSALPVDTLGNQVLEPGKMVDVRPN